MRKLVFLLFGLLLFACDSNEDTTQEQDFANLTETFNNIQQTALSVPCTDPSDWRFTPYGEKACGGPQGFIAYPITIDTVDFLNRIEGHRIREDFLNEKWGLFSTCDVPPAPQSVDCVDGLPVLIY